MSIIGKKNLFFEVRQDPNTDRVLAQVPHVGRIVDKIRVKNEPKYLVQSPDRDKPFEVFPEDVEKFIDEAETYQPGPLATSMLFKHPNPPTE